MDAGLFERWIGRDLAPVVGVRVLSSVVGPTPLVRPRAGSWREDVWLRRARVDPSPKQPNGALRGYPLANLSGDDASIRIFLAVLWMECMPTPTRAPTTAEWAGTITGEQPRGRRDHDRRELPEIRRVTPAFERLRTLGLIGPKDVERISLTQPWACGLHVAVGSGSPVAHRTTGWNVQRDLRVPATLWTEGWTTRLSARALLAWFTLLALRADRQPVRFRTNALAERIETSDETLRRGRDDLLAEGLVVLAHDDKAPKRPRHQLDTNSLLRRQP